MMLKEKVYNFFVGLRGIDITDGLIQTAALSSEKNHHKPAHHIEREYTVLWKIYTAIHNSAS
jgi:hypothetical protein